MWARRQKSLKARKLQLYVNSPWKWHPVLCLCYIVLYWLEAAHTLGEGITQQWRIRSLGSLRTAYAPLPVMTAVHMLFGYFILMNSENYDRWVGEESCWHKTYVKTWKSHLLNKMSLDYLWIGKLLKTLTVHRFVHRWLISCLILELQIQIINYNWSIMDVSNATETVLKIH